MREPIPTFTFVLVVVRQNGRYLVVREKKHGQRWYLPAGRVDPGETLEQAARRETLEESGVSVDLEGILEIDHTPLGEQARLRVIYLARPAPGSRPPGPTEDCLDAGWRTLEEVEDLALRGQEVLRLFGAVARGCPVYPLGLICQEGR